MPQIDQPISPTPKTAAEEKKPKTATTAKPVGGLYSFTVDTGDKRIVSVERIDAEGGRHPLTSEEKAKLAKVQTAAPLRHIVERAFEAGVEYVLGSESGPETPETKEEGELSGMLIRTMIQGSKAKELVKGDALDRTVVDSLIIHATK